MKRTRAKKERSWFWSSPDRANAESYNLQKRQSGFLIVGARNFHVRSVEAYGALLDNTRPAHDRATWEIVEAEIDKCFKVTLEPFPYASGKAREGALRVAPTDPSDAAGAMRGEVGRSAPGETGAASQAAGAEDSEERGEAQGRGSVDDSAEREHFFRRTLARIVGFRLPPAFFRIQLRTILKRFPKGTSAELIDGDPRDSDGEPRKNKARLDSIDGDIRGYITALRYVYGKNLWRLIMQRRWNATWASALTLVAFALFAGGLVSWRNPDALDWLPPALSASIERIQVGEYGLQIAAAVGALICLYFVSVFIQIYPKLTDEFLNSVDASCPRVGAAVGTRFAYFGNTVAEVHRQIREEPSEKKHIDWREQARGWTKLAIWMALRAQHLEQYFQIEMWRMRRMEAWLRLIGYLITGVTLVIALALLTFMAVVVIVLPTALLAKAAAVVGWYVAFRLLTHVNRVVLRKQRTGRNIIKEGFSSLFELGFADTKLRNESAGTVSSLIRALLNYREIAAGH